MRIFKGVLSCTLILFSINALAQTGALYQKTSPQGQPVISSSVSGLQKVGNPVAEQLPYRKKPIKQFAVPDTRDSQKNEPVTLPSYARIKCLSAPGNVCDGSPYVMTNRSDSKTNLLVGGATPYEGGWAMYKFVPQSGTDLDFSLRELGRGWSISTKKAGSVVVEGTNTQEDVTIFRLVETDQSDQFFFYDTSDDSYVTVNPAGELITSSTEDGAALFSLERDDTWKPGLTIRFIARDVTRRLDVSNAKVHIYEESAPEELLASPDIRDHDQRRAMETSRVEFDFGSRLLVAIDDVEGVYFPELQESIIMDHEVIRWIYGRSLPSCDEVESEIELEVTRYEGIGYKFHFFNSGNCRNDCSIGPYYLLLSDAASEANVMSEATDEEASFENGCEDDVSSCCTSDVYSFKDKRYYYVFNETRRRAEDSPDLLPSGQLLFSGELPD